MEAGLMRWDFRPNINFYIDNPHQTIKEWPFDKPFHLIFNLAVGGNWGGRKGVNKKKTVL